MASSLTPSPATLCPMRYERLTNEKVDEMIHETDGGKRIKYKEFIKKHRSNRRRRDVDDSVWSPHQAGRSRGGGGITAAVSFDGGVLTVPSILTYDNAECIFDIRSST
uniref:Uncharacterized protein n=1 Tax=Oryza nivara TaxID=4536 RepID=A0A0E0J2Q6_ORYNI